MGNIQASIELIDVYSRYIAIGCGLRITSNNIERFPLLVGCSFKTLDDKVIDIPARRIASPGTAFWLVDIPDECRSNPTASIFSAEWEGFIIFAVYDKYFDNKLSSTGWVRWKSDAEIGVNEIPFQNEKIEALYRPDSEVWLPL